MAEAYPKFHRGLGHHQNTGNTQQDARTTRPGAAPGPLLRVLRDRRTAFLLVGVVNTAVGLGAFVAFHHVFGPRLYLLTLLAAHVVSVLVAFVLYRRLVFKVRGQVWKDLWRFETVYLVGLAGNALLLTFGVSVLHLPVLLCQVVITALQALWSWVGHGRFSFQRPEPLAADEPVT